MGWITLIVCVFIALVMYACCAAEKQAEEAAEEMRLKRLLLDSERLTEAAIASDVGRRRGFQDGYEACRDELAEKMKEVADRPKGVWIDAEIPLESGGSMPIQACNLCKTFYPLAYTGGGHRFCPNCGARMKGADDE